MIAIKKTRAKRQTLLRDFYRSIRRELAAKYSVSYLWLYDAAVERAAEWRGAVAVEEIDEAWAREFNAFLLAARLTPKSAEQLVLCIKRLARRLCPYRFTAKVSAEGMKSVLKDQPAGHLGHFFVNAYEPNLPAGTSQKSHLLRAVWRLHVWHGAPVRLEHVSNELLENFESAEVARGTSAKHAHQLCRYIRQIVNSANPGTIRRKYDPPAPPVCIQGTVQHFVQNEYIPARKWYGKKLLHVQCTMRRLHEYCGRKGLPFRKFTSDFCSDFLHWCLAHRENGRPIGGITINERMRFELVAISKALVVAGKIQRRVFIEAVGDVRRHRKRAAGPALPAKKAKARNTGGRAMGRRGRSIEWPDALRFLLSISKDELTSHSPAALRDRFRGESPLGKLPPRDEFRALVSRVRRNIVPKGFK